MSKTKGMSHDREHFPGKRKDTDINEGQNWVSHDIDPKSPKPSSPTKRSGGRILRGYCEARKFVTLTHFALGPKARAEEGYSRGNTMRVQITLRHSRGWFCPRHPQGTPKRKGKNGIGTVLGKTEHIHVDRERTPGQYGDKGQKKGYHYCN